MNGRDWQFGRETTALEKAMGSVERGGGRLGKRRLASRLLGPIDLSFGVSDGLFELEI